MRRTAVLSAAVLWAFGLVLIQPAGVRSNPDPPLPEWRRPTQPDLPVDLPAAATGWGAPSALLSNGEHG